MNDRRDSHSVDDRELTRTDVELTVADAHWRYVIKQKFGMSDDEDVERYVDSKSGADPVIRMAYEERLRALQAWRKARKTS